ncbi:MAG TPA: 50S ribosomal protein L15 [Bryobacteraceae bacterium]|nr:50S ribosomal protein L15 [Bryobacteraceae bacterium]
MNLSNIKPPAGQKKNKRRLGQGMGTGRGKFAGRGAKGAKSISGYSRMRGFEGGQMPLHRRLPKRGFSNAMFKKTYAIVNVAALNDLEGANFDVASLMAAGVIKKLEDGLKILGNGEITRAITVTAHIFSAAAKEKIEKAGGTVNVIAAPTRKPKEQ